MSRFCTADHAPEWYPGVLLVISSFEQALRSVFGLMLKQRLWMAYAPSARHFPLACCARVSGSLPKDFESFWAACRSSPFTSKCWAAVKSAVEELREARMVLPEESPQTSRYSHTLCLPVELPDEFKSSSQGEFNLSFGSREEDELSITASVIAKSAKRIGLEWTTPPCSECSQVDDWFLGTECNTKPHSGNCGASLPAKCCHQVQGQGTERSAHGSSQPRGTALGD